MLLARVLLPFRTQTAILRLLGCFCDDGFPPHFGHEGRARADVERNVLSTLLLSLGNSEGAIFRTNSGVSTPLRVTPKRRRTRFKNARSSSVFVRTTRDPFDEPAPVFAENVVAPPRETLPGVRTVLFLARSGGSFFLGELAGWLSSPFQLCGPRAVSRAMGFSVSCCCPAARPTRTVLREGRRRSPGCVFLVVRDRMATNRLVFLPASGGKPAQCSLNIAIPFPSRESVSYPSLLVVFIDHFQPWTSSATDSGFVLRFKKTLLVGTEDYDEETRELQGFWGEGFHGRSSKRESKSTRKCVSSRARGLHVSGWLSSPKHRFGAPSFCFFDINALRVVFRDKISQVIRDGEVRCP